MDGASSMRGRNVKTSNVKTSNAKANNTSLNNTSLNNMSLSSTSLSSVREQAEPRGLAGRHVAALGLAIVSFTASERAAANCLPLLTSPTTVSCFGVTRNQSNPDGFGSLNDTGNT